MRWQPIEPLPAVNSAVAPILATVDSLRRAWEEALESSTAEEREAAQARRLRRHAVETGIIERLYEVDWGTTEVLVAEGLSMEVANRAGGISAQTLQIIRDRYDALELLTSLAQEGTELSVYLIRQLHQISTRHQHTYEARHQFGCVFQRPLRHGERKQQPNHVRRPDGSVLEYAPPEHVQSEMEQLVEIHRESADAHPLVRAAWLHHRFIQIHPFEDGNGRVARALTLLVLPRDRYAPPVVDRRERTSYLTALDTANDGDLSELVRFFGRLEIAALQSTLTQPVALVRDAEPTALVDALVRQLRDLRDAASVEKRTAAEQLATEVHAAVVAYLDGQARSFRRSLSQLDPAAKASVTYGRPPDDKARYWRRQIIAAANSIDFYTNLADGAWWARLQMEALGERLRYLAFVQKVGHGETGVLALTVFAELVRPEPDEVAAAVEPEPVLELGPTDSVTFAYTDRFAERYAEVEDLLRRTLRDAVESFVTRLG
jgi:Fic/DOC family